MGNSDDPPSPLPGEPIEIDLSDLFPDDPFVVLRAEIAAMKADLARLRTYLGATPKVTRIEQLRAYLKGAGQ
jgi:hypothetical protein